VDNLYVVTRFADCAVATSALTALQFFQWAVNTDKEDIIGRQQRDQLVHPRLKLDDMIDDKVMVCPGNRWQTAVKGMKEARPHGAPGKVSILIVPIWQHTCLNQLVRCHVPERLVNTTLNRLCERRLPRAGGTIQENDVAKAHVPLLFSEAMPRLACERIAGQSAEG
jgi:hypothetical protein